MAAVRKKRETALEKASYILKPFVVYMIMKTIVLIGLSLLVSTMAASVQVQTGNQLTTICNAIAGIVGVSFVLRDFMTETDAKGEVLFDVSLWKQLVNYVKKGFQNVKGKEIQLGAVISLGMTSALFLNGLLTALSLSSEKYDAVEKIQYSVPMWLGIFLYGIVSPVVEEIVFRGLTYHRMRRFFKVPSSVLVSALLFGGFHANLPQFIYGTLMGCLMACCYEWADTFAAPLVFHMAANTLIFVLSGMPGLNQAIANVPAFAIFGLLSVGLLVVVKKGSRKE